MKRLLLCTALLTAHAPTPLAWADTDDAAATKAGRDIVLTGQDADLTAAVAAELRAAGFTVTVIPPGGSLEIAGDDVPTVVEVRREGDLVVVQATMMDDLVEVPPSAHDGMSDQDAAALRAAETIRLLVTAQQRNAPGDDAQRPPGELEDPKVDTTPAPPAVARPPMRTPSVAVMVDPTLRDQVSLPPEGALPLLRIGLQAGIGGLTHSGGYDGGMPFEGGWTVGASLGGNLTREVNLVGRLSFMHNVEGIADNGSEVWSLRSTLLSLWEPLGADHTWTPVLGGGFFGEVMGVADTFFDDGCSSSGHDEQSQYVCDAMAYDFYDDQDVWFNAGLSANVGFTVARPIRFRMDVQGNMQVLSLGVGEVLRVMPSFTTTLGLEYDLVSIAPAAQVAGR